MLCGQRALSPESVTEVLGAQGFDVVDFGGSFGGMDVSFRGSLETLFKARELVLGYVETRGWEKGPWSRIAEVRHRATPTAQVLGRLQANGMPTYFHFGENTDFIFVKCEDAVRAGELLRHSPFRGVVVHDGR